MNFFLEFVAMNLCTMEDLRLGTVVERGNKATRIKDSIEKRHKHFCKMCLGLNKRSVARSFQDFARTTGQEKTPRDEADNALLNVMTGCRR